MCISSLNRHRGLPESDCELGNLAAEGGTGGRARNDRDHAQEE